MKGIATAPISSRQALLLVEDKLHPGLPVNHVLTRLRIHGSVDVGAFQRAFAQLVRRHQSLRSVIVETPGRMEIRVLSEYAGHCEFLDFHGLQDVEREYDCWLQAYCRVIFAPTEPPHRAVLVRLGEQEFVFHLNQHHAMTDGLSCVLLHSQLAALYSQEEDGSTGLGKDLPVPEFCDFLDRTHELTQTAAARASEEYWTHRYSLPPDPGRFYGVGGESKRALTRRVCRRLGPELSARLWAGEGQASPALAFATVLFAFLRRISGDCDFSIGVPLLNREPQFRETCGLLMEIVPNRVQMVGDEPFAELLEKVRAEVAAIRPHRAHPVTARRAGYEVLLNVHTASPDRFAGRKAEYELTTPLNLLERLEGEDLPADWSGRESLSIQVHHDESTREFELAFDFNQGAWPEAELRERAVDHFLRLLGHFLDQVQLPIDALEILTPRERLALFTSESEDHDRNLPTVIENFEARAALAPDAPALRFKDEVLSYGQLDQRVRALSARLRTLGVGAGVLVGVCLERSPELIVALLATLRAGGAYVPIDPNHPDERIALILEDADPGVLLSQSSLRHKFAAPMQPRIFCLDQVSPEVDGVDADVGIVPAELAYVIFTSGSTGRPKGVSVRHRSLAIFLRAMAREPGLAAEDRLLAVTTVSFDIAALELFLPLTVGASVRLAPYEASLDAQAILTLVARDDVTVMQATPATFRMMLASGWQRTSGLRVFCGGEAMSPALAEQLLDRCAGVWNMYGPTETTIWSSVKRLQRGERVSLGHPIDGTRFYVLNSRLQPVPIGVPGELFIAGEGLAAGYHRRDELTREKFLPDPFSAWPGARMYRTGDLVRTLPTLESEYLGRLDFQVKVRGFRIELGEIETALAAFEGIREAVVAACPDPAGGQYLAAYIVLDQGVSLIPSVVRGYLRTRLPTYMVPAAVIVLEAMPLTPAGKIDRKMLPEPESREESREEAGFVTPNLRDALEVAVATAWRGVLGMERIGVHDNFFDLGGDSLSALTLVHDIERATGIGVDLGNFFKAPTIRQMVEGMQSDFSNRGWSMVPLRTGGDSPPLYCLAGIHVYQRLADSLGRDCPVFGVYVSAERAVIDETAADTSIEQWAMAYRDAIVQHQPNGPYQLAGISIGGVLAVETARLLRAQGREVSIVVLLDSILPSGIRRSRTKWLWWQLRRVLGEGLVPFLSRVRRRVSHKQELRQVAGADRGEFNENKLGQVLRRERAFVRAINNFEAQLKPYEGDVVLMRATDRSHFGPAVELSPDYGWGKCLAGRLETRDVPGDHMSLVEAEHVDRLAEALRPFLR